MKILSSFFILSIRFYQLFISSILPARCRFYPSCSDYTIGVIEKYGLIKAIPKAIKRVMSCHPWNPGGYDPVK